MKKITLLLAVTLLISNFCNAQKKEEDKKPATITDPLLKPETYSSLSFRSIETGIDEGKHNIFEGGGAGKKIKCLKNKPDLFVADLCQLVVEHAGH